MSDFAEELRASINRCSEENGCNTPDFMLAEYLISCLDAFNKAVNQREKWYGRNNYTMGNSRLTGPPPAQLLQDPIQKSDGEKVNESWKIVGLHCQMPGCEQRTPNFYCSEHSP